MKRRDFFISAVASTALFASAKALKPKVYEYDVQIPYPKFKEKGVLGINKVLELVDSQKVVTDIQIEPYGLTRESGIDGHRRPSLLCKIKSTKDLSGRVMSMTFTQSMFNSVTLYQEGFTPIYRRTSLPLGQVLQEGENILEAYGWQYISAGGKMQELEMGYDGVLAPGPIYLGNPMYQPKDISFDR